MFYFCTASLIKKVGSQGNLLPTFGQEHYEVVSPLSSSPRAGIGSHRLTGALTAGPV